MFDLKAKAFDLRFSGFSKLVDDRVAVSETRVAVAEALVEQLTITSRRQANREVKQNKAGESLVAALQTKIESLEGDNMALRLELQSVGMARRVLEKELEFSQKSLEALKNSVEQSFLATNANRTADLENNNFKLKVENSALLEERSKLEDRLKVALAEKLKMEANVDEIKGNYEKEVTNLKIQLKNASLRVSKSKFCSTTNLNLEKQTDLTQQPTGSKSKSQFPSANESIPKPNKTVLERQDSFAKQSWSDIKDMLHAKGESKNGRMNSGRSQSESIKSKKPSSSASSGTENDLEHDLGSESSSQEKAPGPVETSIIKKSNRLSQSVRPSGVVRSAQALPLITGVKTSATSPMSRYVHQSMDEYRDRFEKANMTIDTLRCEMTTIEMRLKKKDEHIGEMKKELAAAKVAASARQAEKESLRGELVAVQHKLIVAQCELVDVRQSESKPDTGEVLKLKSEIERLKSEAKVGTVHVGVHGRPRAHHRAQQREQAAQVAHHQATRRDWRAEEKDGLAEGRAQR